MGNPMELMQEIADKISETKQIHFDQEIEKAIEYCFEVLMVSEVNPLLQINPYGTVILSIYDNHGMVLHEVTLEKESRKIDIYTARW